MKKLAVIFALLFLISTNVKSQSLEEPEIKNIALYPQQNQYRNKLDISGMWKFQVDRDNVGEKEQWYEGLKESTPIAVPGSWNEQREDLRDYLGYAWYEQNIFVPSTWKDQKIFIRFGSASYAAKVWINGEPLGKHEGPHLPFAFEITDRIKWDKENKITVQVENFLKPDRVPPGNVGGKSSFIGNYPATTYDFFPYSGLQRQVWLYSVPENNIQDITVKTDIQGNDGIVNLEIENSGNVKEGKVIIDTEEGPIESDITFQNNRAQSQLTLPNADFWSPNKPNLYKLTVNLGDENSSVDSYQLKIGVRTVGVDNKHILLNGKPIFLKGFGKHEDFPVFGKGTAYPVISKDYSLLKWIGANSYRTSHYPYDEEYMNMADEVGILITDEIPAVGLYFDEDTESIEARKEMAKKQIKELIMRDKNHPSVIIWSLANEPHSQTTMSLMGQEEASETSIDFFNELIKTAKDLDDTRLTSYASVQNGPVEWMGLFDIISINRYYGWYTQGGQIEEGVKVLEKELDDLYDQFHKPILFTEFGTDTYSGFHSFEPEMFTEEYQVEFLKAYMDLADSKEYVTGVQLWAFADFKTAQGIIRFKGMNWKGVFTRDRKPKQAAFYLNKRWNNKK